MLNSSGGNGSDQFERDFVFLRRLAGAGSDAACEVNLAAPVRLIARRPRSEDGDEEKGAAEATPSALWRQWEDQRSCLSRS